MARTGPQVAGCGVTMTTSNKCAVMEAKQTNNTVLKWGGDTMRSSKPGTYKTFIACMCMCVCVFVGVCLSMPLRESGSC